MSHSPSLPPESSNLLSEIQKAVSQAPRALRGFRFYDLRSVFLKSSVIVDDVTTHSSGYNDRNFVTRFDGRGMAEVSVPTAGYLLQISSFSVPQEDNKARVEAYTDAPDDLRSFGDAINDENLHGLILHEGLPNGSLVVWPDDSLDLVEAGHIERQGVTSFRLTAQGRGYRCLRPLA